MSAEVTRVSPGWLELREPADAEARARDLAEALERALPASGPRVIHDLGCGTGAMGRWLAPLLAGPQHWVLHDRDPDLLKLAAADAPGPAADGAPVTVEARREDIARMPARDLAGATLITASALLDMLTADELDRLAGLCGAVGCPILLTLSVIGSVEITPADPLDRRVAAAFDAHQRRATERGRLLGPDAVDFAARAFRRRGAEILVRPSPWQLGPAHSALAVEWFTGWVGAACEQEVELAGQCGPYVRRRLGQASAGELAVTVGHADLLVLPGSGDPGGVWPPRDARDVRVCGEKATGRDEAGLP
jgi:SAM-dependent methyltransferase